MIKGAIFDMDGLMFDTERVYRNSWITALEKRGLTCPKSRAFMRSLKYRKRSKKERSEAEMPQVFFFTFWPKYRGRSNLPP